MKTTRKACLTLAAVLVLGIAALAVAGYLLDDGKVVPSDGDANDTIFRYTVTYSLSPYETPPSVLVIAYLDEEEEFREMMSIAAVGEVFVEYWYETRLPTASFDWTFQFTVVGGGSSNVYCGPTVY